MSKVSNFQVKKSCFMTIHVQLWLLAARAQTKTSLEPA